jgi:hypothetical protein
MKSNAITAVRVALVNLPLTVKPHLLFPVRRAKMESGTGAAMARLTVAHPIRFTRGNYSKRATVALPGSFHRSPPAVIGGHFGRFLRLPSTASKAELFGWTSTDVGPDGTCAAKISGG